jgi:hypothetical protein
VFWQGIRKVRDKGIERIATSKALFAIRNSSRVHMRRVISTTAIILVFILGTIIVNSGSSRTVAYAYTMRGVGVGIYWDQACTNRTLSLNWGPIEPASNSAVLVYVRNEGDTAVSLWMATSNWTPAVASGQMTLNWSYSGQPLDVDQVIPIELNLFVSPSATGITDFSFDIVITTTG